MGGDEEGTLGRVPIPSGGTRYVKGSRRVLVMAGFLCHEKSDPGRLGQEFGWEISFLGQVYSWIPENAPHKQQRKVTKRTS